MRSYGLTYKGKDEGKWKGNSPAHYRSCCYSLNQGFIMYGRNRRKVRRVKRAIKTRARQEAKREIERQLDDMGH